jgi:Zn-dependent alcohol dehydrogenase
MNNLKPQHDSSIVIFGLGAVGLSALMAASYMKVRQIIAVDIQPSKLSLAKDLGATDLINGRDIADVVGRVKELTGDAGADLAVECTGIPAVIEDALNCLGLSGTAAQVGAPPRGTKISIDPSQVLRGSQKYVGCRMGDSVPQVYIPKLVDLQRKGDFPVETIVKVYDYKDLDKALHDMHEGTTTKPVIQWS